MTYLAGRDAAQVGKKEQIATLATFNRAGRADKCFFSREAAL